MSLCSRHGYYSASFCRECDSTTPPGPDAAILAGYRLFNEDRALGQNQYASRYVEGRHGKPNLGEGFRFKGVERHDYHSIYIHVDDYDAFRQKVRDHQKGLS